MSEQENRNTLGRFFQALGTNTTWISSTILCTTTTSRSTLN